MNNPTKKTAPTRGAVFLVRVTVREAHRSFRFCLQNAHPKMRKKTSQSPLAVICAEFKSVLFRSPRGSRQTTDKPHYKNNSSSKCINLLATFSLQEEGANEKRLVNSPQIATRVCVIKKKRRKGNFAVCRTKNLQASSRALRARRGGLRSLHRAAF